MSVSGARWQCAPEIYAMEIDSNHKLVFNPLGEAGVVVLNQRASRIFESFRQPATVDDAVKLGLGPLHEVSAVCARLSDLGMLRPEGPSSPPQFQRSKTVTAWLHVTNACNLRCPYCYVNKSDDPMTEPVGRSAVEAVMRSAVSHGFTAVKLKYAGGEASLNHRLVVRLHEHARVLAAELGLELQATVLTNGVALPRAFVRFLKEHGIRVMISLDGVGDQHDAQRPLVSGRPSFHFVVRTIGQLIEEGHPPHLSVTITNRNADGIADVVRFALARNLTFSLNFFRDNDCAAGFTDLQYEEHTLTSALLDAFKVIEEEMPPWSVLGAILDRGQLLQPRERSCGVGQDYVVIDQHGRVAKCHMEIERTLGDVFRDDPLGLVLEDRTTALNLAVSEKEGCRDCTWRYWCSGGCTVATFRATGRYDIKSPNCNIYKAIYPQALHLEALRLLKYGAPALQLF
jgi:uncharacterized protein